MIKRKPKRQKYWSGKRYWRTYLAENGYELRRNNERTISYVLGNNYRLVDESDESFEKFVLRLSQSRDEALQEIRDTGTDVWVTGEHQIEIISSNPKYEAEHYRRLARQLGQKIVATGRKSPSATIEQRKQFGLPSPFQIKQVKKRLLLGGSNVEVEVTK